MRRKLIISMALGILSGYSLNIHIYGVIAPFILPGLDGVKGKFLLLLSIIISLTIFFFLLLGKWDIAAEGLRILESGAGKLLRVIVAILIAVPLAVGLSYLLHGWLFPPVAHDIELAYIDGYIKITRVLLPGREQVDLSTLDYAPVEAWEIDSQNVNAIHPYAKLAFTLRDADYVKFFFAANSAGLVYFNVDGSAQPVVEPARHQSFVMSPFRNRSGKI